MYGAAGAVAGLFTYEDGQNESDIEILTRDDPNEIRYSNQPVVDNRMLSHSSIAQVTLETIKS